MFLIQIHVLKDIRLWLKRYLYTIVCKQKKVADPYTIVCEQKKVAD